MPNALNQIPDGLHAAQDYERLAPEFIEPSTWHYIQGGSGQELTLQANQGALARLRLQPRLLRPLAHGHTRLTLLGQPRLHPILLAPVAYQRLVHPLGELATAQGAHAMDAGMIVSTLSSTLLEDIAPLTHDKWFQLYFQPNRQVTLDLIRRAEHAQYQALVVTLDATIKSPSGRALRSGFVMPDAVRHVNLDRYPTPTSRPLRHGDSMVFQGIMADAPTWTICAGCKRKLSCRSWSKAFSTPRMRASCKKWASPRKWSPTMADVRWMVPLPASQCCRPFALRSDPTTHSC